MDTNQLKEKIQEIKKEIGVYSLHISRVPKATYDKFMQFASNDEFCKDYGMALKFLLDFYFGIIPTGNEHLEMQLAELRNELVDIKLQLPQNKEGKKERRTLSGKVIG